MNIAVISTVWFPLSHTDVIVSRWVRPYPGDASFGWTASRSRIASIFIEQFPENDMGVAFCERHALPRFETIADALTLGTDALAVDAVLLIGEHGDYPRNEYGQKLYPRKRLFDVITTEFRRLGRAVPIFNDKHFSWDFSHSCEMFATARELGFPLYGGSSVPQCPLDPAPPLAPGEGVTEALALFHGDQDNYGFHTIEFAESLLERRPGGETGVRAVRSYAGPAVIQAIEQGEIPRDLVHRALVQHGYPNDESIVSFVLERAEELLAYQIEHTDGLRVTHLRLQKWVTEWVVALRKSSGEIASCRSFMGSCPDFHKNFAILNSLVEEFFLTGKAPTPVERTHLATGTLEAVQKALKSEGQWVATPQLSISY